MRKARIVLAIVVMLTIVSTTLMVRAGRYGSIVYSGSALGGVCNVAVLSYTTAIVSGAVTKGGFFAGASGGACNTTIVYRLN
jgi:hypothetical protein